MVMTGGTLTIQRLTIMNGFVLGTQSHYSFRRCPIIGVLGSRPLAKGICTHYSHWQQCGTSSVNCGKVGFYQIGKNLFKNLEK